MTSKYNCPECGSALNAWADIDVKISFQVNKKGKLVKRAIDNHWQTDGRCGIECTNRECMWDLDDDNWDEFPHLAKLADETCEYQNGISTLSPKTFI